MIFIKNSLSKMHNESIFLPWLLECDGIKPWNPELAQEKLNLHKSLKRTELASKAEFEKSKKELIQKIKAIYQNT